MKAAELTVRGVKSAAERAAVNRLIARIQAPPTKTCMAWLDSVGARWPEFRLEHTRAAYDGGKLVGALRLHTFTLCIGAARLKVGGLGWVSTDPAVRGRGVCRALMDDAHAYMAANGYAASVLFGIPNLYERFGYVSVIPEHAAVVDVEAVPPVPHRTRAVKPPDLPVLQRIFAANGDPDGLTIERTAALWRASFACKDATIPLHPDWKRAAALVEDGKLRGWFQAQKEGDTLHIKEIGAADWGAAAKVLSACASAARTARAKTLRLHIPANHLAARYLREYEARFETHTFKDREGMIRLIDAAAFFDAMTPEWTRRAAGLPKGSFAAVVGDTARVIAWDGKKAAHRPFWLGAPITLSSQDFVRLAAGQLGGETLRGRNGLAMAEPEARLFDAFFPDRTAYVPAIDHF